MNRILGWFNGIQFKNYRVTIFEHKFKQLKISNLIIPPYTLFIFGFLINMWSLESFLLWFTSYFSILNSQRKQIVSKHPRMHVL